MVGDARLAVVARGAELRPGVGEALGGAGAGGACRLAGGGAAGGGAGEGELPRGARGPGGGLPRALLEERVVDGRRELLGPEAAGLGGRLLGAQDAHRLGLGRNGHGGRADGHGHCGGCGKASGAAVDQHTA